MVEPTDIKKLRAEVEAIEEERLQKRLAQLAELGTTSRVLQDVEWERDEQNQKWGGAGHDDQHGPRDWAAFITEHLGKALDARDARTYRRRMVEVAALAVAAVETVDRVEEARRVA